MNIDNLYEGQVIKNYRELCRLLNIKVQTGSAKIAQIKELETYLSFERNKNSFKIIEIYKEKRIKEDNRKYNNRKYFSNFNISFEDEKKHGVYGIVNGSDIYIGSTCNKEYGFRGRFLTHMRGVEGFEYTKKMLDEGGIFIPLWVANELEHNNISLIRSKEIDFIRQYRNNPKFNVVNKYLFPIKRVPKNKRIKSSRPTIKNIKVSEKDYDKAIKILLENNINIVNK